MTEPTNFEVFLPFSTIFIPAAGLRDFVAADGQPYGAQTNRVPMQECMNTITAVWNGQFPIALLIRDSRTGFWNKVLELPEAAGGGVFPRNISLRCTQWRVHLYHSESSRHRGRSSSRIPMRNRRHPDRGTHDRVAAGAVV